MKNNPYRHELKYIINMVEYEYLTRRISYVLKNDHHYKEAVYGVRSLYFDDVIESALTTKLDGLEYRKKYRIRLYNHSPDFIRLECKLKSNQFIKKEQLRISKSYAEKIIDGSIKQETINFEGGKIIEGTMLNLFFIERFLYSPSILIDYQRETYIGPKSDVRITFDKELSYSINSSDLFDETVYMKRYYQEPLVIMEVKYTTFLPTYVKNLLQLDRFTQTSISKYAMCKLERKNYTY